MTGLLLFSCIIIAAQPVKTHGQLKVNGTQLVDKNGKPVVLRGVSFGWHNFWP
ncbi:MAG: glycoside hydrolase family 5 protein, partial [Bacteroidota bacterium]